MLSESIAKLVQYGITTGLTPECERNYTTNLLLDVFHEDDYEKPDKQIINAILFLHSRYFILGLTYILFTIKIPVFP